MPIANPKSFVAGSLVLVMAVRTVFGHATALHNFNLVLCTAVSALCFWHAFMGRRPLLAKSEVESSIWLGALSVIIASGFTVIGFIGLKYRRYALQFVIAILFSAAAVFFFWTALQERHSGAAEDRN